MDAQALPHRRCSIVAGFTRRAHRSMVACLAFVLAMTLAGGLWGCSTSASPAWQPLTGPAAEPAGYTHDESADHQTMDGYDDGVEFFPAI